MRGSAGLCGAATLLRGRSGRGIALISAARPGRFHFHRAKLTWTWGGRRGRGGRSAPEGRSGVADRQGNLAEREGESMWLLKPQHNNNIKKKKKRRYKTIMITWRQLAICI